MEEIDIENLNFDEYNREVYQENNKKEERSHLFDGLSWATGLLSGSVISPHQSDRRLH